MFKIINNQTHFNYNQTKYCIRKKIKRLGIIQRESTAKGNKSAEGLKNNYTH